MLTTKRTPLSHLLAQKWSDTAHLLLLDEITRSNEWKPKDLIFHGGTSLYLIWGGEHGPGDVFRFSEDMDFLINERCLNLLTSSVVRMQSRIEQRMRTVWPDVNVWVKAEGLIKECKRLKQFKLIIGQDDIIGTAKVKAEFWPVSKNYLQRFESIQVEMGGEINSALDVATLESAYLDKVCAISMRQFFKWRDVFDLWWIGKRLEQNDFSAEQVQTHASAYNGEEPLEDGLRRFLSMDNSELVNNADQDLKRWIPYELWSQLQNGGIEEIICYAKCELDKIERSLRAASSARNNGARHPVESSNGF